jgi:hypothetical protein
VALAVQVSEAPANGRWCILELLMRFLTAVITLAGVALAAMPAQAQDRGRAPDSVPAALRPPPGMCRIWLNGVPPNRQPAPTDCATAVKNRPANGRVIFGQQVTDAKPGMPVAPKKDLPANALPVVPPLPKKPPPRN